MSVPAGLRRLGPADRAAVVALQREAYAVNRALLGVEPLPLLADYDDLLARLECWGIDRDQRLSGVLMLEPRDDDLLIWSVATLPSAQGGGIGRALLALAEDRAHALGRSAVRLYTGQRLTANVAWYSRHGWMVERVEPLPDRTVVHMIKPAARDAGQAGRETTTQGDTR